MKIILHLSIDITSLLPSVNSQSIHISCNLMYVTCTHAHTHTQLSARAIKDYNRGRAYLASVANKNRVPIYTNIPDAVHRAMHLVKGHYLTPSNVPLTETSV